VSQQQQSCFGERIKIDSRGRNNHEHSILNILIQPILLKDLLLPLLLEVVLRWHPLGSLAVGRQIEHVGVLLIPDHLKAVDEVVDVFEQIAQAAAALDLLGLSDVQQPLPDVRLPSAHLEVVYVARPIERFNLEKSMLIPEGLSTLFCYGKHIYNLTGHPPL